MSEKDELSTPYTDDGRNIHLPLPSTNPAPAPAQTNKSKLFKLALLWGTIYAGTWYFDTSVSDFIARPDVTDIEETRQGWGSDPYFRGLIDKGWKIDGTVDEKLLELLEGIDTSGHWLQGDSYAFGNEYEVEKHHKKDKHKHKHGKDKKKKKHGHHHDDDDDEHHHHHHGPPGRHHPPGPPHGPPGPHHPPGHPGHHGPGGPRIGPKEAESIFLGVPNNDSVAAASKRYTAYPHMAGTGNDLISAINLKAEYETLLGLPFSAPYEKIYPAGSEENQRMVRGLGEREEVAVWVDEYYPLMNKPVHRSVDIILPESNGVIEWSAKLREDIVEGDPDSVFRDEVPTFHGLSVSGNVTGKIVYAGYGTKRDFDALEAQGFDLRSEPTIVLVKYGKVFRGLKIKAAQEAGALACLIYSDPGDDGEITVKNGYKAYPDGPARQPSSVQRGSVQFLSSYPGDPATPGYPAWKNATRVPGGNFPSIPSLPISYQDALPLLRTLQGHGMPAADVGDDWVGGLTDEIDYWTGPGDRDVRFVNEVDTKETPIWSVFGYIPGHIKDELVVLGNHRDAWVLGGADPSSGTATMYEVLRGLNQLMRKGWKPMRSILIASWDAEEYGLISSTEFAEDFGDWIQSNVVAYLNLDVSVAGTNFHGSASPSLANLLKGAAEQIEHPTDPARSLWEMKDGGDWKTYNQEVKAFSSEVDFEDLAASRSGVGALGSGSDYTAFLQRYGVASTDMGYGGGPNDPPYHYHSIYDSFTWQSRYGDPGFVKHTAAAKMLGLMALRLADSLVLPLNVTQYAHDLSGYLAKVEAIAQTDDYKVNFTGLSSAINEVQNATSVLDSVAEQALKKLGELLPHPSPKPHPSPLPPKKMKEIKKVLEQIRTVNGKLAGFESGFLSKQGIKDREWYKHKGTAPGKWLGYGATTFPGLTEAMTIDHDVKAAQEEADELEVMMLEIAKHLKI